MCGIFGFFSKTGFINSQELSKSINLLKHRGPDNTGIVLFQKGLHRYYSNLVPKGEWSSVLSHTRLSIIDLTEAANQPMSNEDDTVWVVYNGEIYNFNEIREDLKAHGHKFRSRTDSEVIIHGYEEWGIDVVQRFRGMFAFAIFDQRKNKLILARDRLGVKPLKYFYNGETFIFASELKGLIHLIPGRLDLDSVNKFLTLRYIPSPDTVLEGVKKLSPSEILEFDLNTWQMRKDTYWRPEFLNKTTISFSEAKEGFRRLLSESIFIRTISDVPIGVYLSGGIDSSTIVAFLRENGVDSINTFTLRFDRHSYDESEYARDVAQRFQTVHHEFQTPELTYDVLQEIVDSLDEPFGDPSYIPTYFLSKFTSEHVKVILSGDGGDEILGGYKRYFIYSRWKILSLLPPIKANFIKNLPLEINKKSLIGKIQGVSEALSMGYWGAYLMRFNGIRDSLKRFLMTPETYNSFKGFSIEDIVCDFNDSKKIRDTIERLIWIDMHTYLPDYILTKTDLALMAHSVEGRNPFVDYRLVEFSNCLPPEYKFKEGGKYILKRILEEYLPEEIIYRKKMGFNPPIKYWFRANLDLLCEIFSDGNFVSGDIFELKHIHHMIDKFKTTNINISEQLWLIMTLELWRRKSRV